MTRRPQKRLQLLLLLAASSLILLGTAPQAHAIGYNLTVSPVRTQESNTPGVVLALNVTGAAVNTMYKFTFVVTDPTNHNNQAVNSTTTTATQTSFVLTVAYPSKFGWNINFVGNYSINVQENNPMGIPSVATGSFLVGLTDKTSYQRTFPVSIMARGYNANSPLTINISHQGTSASGFPMNLVTDSTGSVSTAWTIPANAPLGVWNVSLTNTSPVKNVPDTQLFTVNPANVTIASLNIGQAALQRTQVQSFSFTANYLSGSVVRIGSAVIVITESDGITTFPIQANYNNTLAEFNVLYRIPSNAETGGWVARINVGGFNDSYGNMGPTSGLTGSFTVNSSNVTIAQLNVGQSSLVKTGKQTFSFSASYSSGVQVQTGSANVRVTETDGTTSYMIVATYNSTLSAFGASYKIPSDSQTGAWVASIDPGSFNDGYGNTGPSSSVVRAFTVQPATLTLSASIPSQTYTLGQVIPVYASITFPDGSQFATGNVTATLSTTTAQIATVTLTYVQGQSEWIGAYTIKSGDPSGVWLVTIKASDPYANVGQVTISAITSVPPPAPAQQPLDLYYFILAAFAIGSGGSGLLLIRRINPTHGGFDEFFKLTGGEIPPGTTLLVLGDAGSGTSTLSQELIHHALAAGGRCGVLTYDAFPSEVIRSMKGFGWDPTENLSNGTFKILDCYSALAGAENAPIRDPVDFTEISIQVSTMIEKASPAPITLVLDSITPIFNSAPARTVINFLRVLSAKIKNVNGILILTGAKGSIPAEVKTNLETTADGVIELSVTKDGQSSIRTLTVRRLAGRKVSTDPAQFSIVQGKGILFRKLRIPLRIVSPKRKLG